MPERLPRVPFTYRVSLSGIAISQGGRPAATLRNAAAAKFIADVEGLDEAAVQHLLARVTGNFKRGNERREPQG